MKRKLSALLVAGALASLAAAPGAANAQVSDGVIKIGVMNDMSGLYADLGGQGSVLAARMAVEDFGASGKGMKVEQNFRFAAPLADQFYVMEHGRIVEQFQAGELQGKMDMLHEFLGV